MPRIYLDDGFYRSMRGQSSAAGVWVESWTFSGGVLPWQYWTRLFLPAPCLVCKTTSLFGKCLVMPPEKRGHSYPHVVLIWHELCITISPAAGKWFDDGLARLHVDYTFSAEPENRHFATCVLGVRQALGAKETCQIFGDPC